MFDLEYSQKKESLFKIFDSLTQKGFMPIETEEKNYNNQFISDLKSKINEDKIYISVCGQMNAGKSSFLNYFLFKGEKTLPESSITETAKLTKIQYGEKNKAIVHFYTSEEWNNLRNEKIEGCEETFFDKMKEDISNCAKQGIYPDNCLNESKEISELSDLREFSGKYGKYQPFVSYIDIFINNDSLKDIVFVDTPGINDPNPIRTRITTKWVNQSTAIIYLMYSQQALGAPDIEFIDNYLQHISSNTIIFCLTKADLLKSNEDIKDFIQNHLREHPDLKKRYLLADNKEVFPVSTLAASLKKKIDESEELSKDEDWYYKEILKKNPECYRQNGYIDKFINEINSTLMKNKGEMLLDDIINNIKAICNLKIRILTEEINKLNNEIAGSIMSNEELGNQIEVIKDKQETIEKNFKDYKIQFDIQSDKAKRIVKKKYEEKEEKIIEKIKKWINGQQYFNDIQNFTLYELKRIIKDVDLYDEGLSENLIKESFSDIIKDTVESSKKEISGIKVFKLYMHETYLLDLDSLEIVFEDVINKEIEKGLSDCKVRKWLFLTNLEESKSNVIAKIIPIIEGIIKEIIDKFRGKIDKFNVNKKSELEQYFVNGLKNLHTQLSDLEKNKNIKTININAIEESIKSLDEQKSILEKEKEIIFNKMKALK